MVPARKRGIESFPSLLFAIPCVLLAWLLCGLGWYWGAGKALDIARWLRS